MPRYNPKDERQLGRLRRSMEWSKTKLKPFREEYLNLLKAYVGFHYGEEHAPEKTPINTFRLAIDIYARQLAAQEPKILAVTFDRQLKAQARMLEEATNHLLEELKLSFILRETVKSALFMMGVVKVGLTAPGESNVKSIFHQAGQPYCDPVLFDDFLWDMTARRPDEWDWAGNRYRVPYDVIMESAIYDQNAKNNLPPPPQEGGEFGIDDDRSHSLSQGSGPLFEEYRHHVELWDLWLPNDQLLVTLPVNSDGPPLRVVEWEGPPRGPFHILTFGDVPGNVMPAAPALQWYDLHDLQNRLFTKLGRQAERQKTIGAASNSGANEGDADRIIRAEDGQVIRCDDPSSVKEITLGGIHDGNMAFTIMCKDMASYIAGNLDAIGGLGQQGETLGQERIIKSSSSQLIEEMSDRVIHFTTGVVTDLGWYLYDDPVSEIPLTLTIPDYGEKIPFTWKPEDRTAGYAKYRIKIEPYSMSPKSPASRLQAVFSIIGQVIAPFQQQMQMQGLELDLETLLGVAAKYADLPELLDIIKSGGIPIGLPGPDVTQASSNPSKPNGQYQRLNIATGGTQQSRDQIMMRQLLGGAGGSQNNSQQLGQMARPAV